MFIEKGKFLQQTVELLLRHSLQYVLIIRCKKEKLPTPASTEILSVLIQFLPILNQVKTSINSSHLVMTKHVFKHHWRIHREFTLEKRQARKY